MGRFQEADVYARRGLELAKENQELRSWAYDAQVYVVDARGDLGPDAMNWARLSAEAAERGGSHQARGVASLSLSIAGILDGQWDAAIANAEKAIESAAAVSPATLLRLSFRHTRVRSSVPEPWSELARFQQTR